VGERAGGVDGRGEISGHTSNGRCELRVPRRSTVITGRREK
jgi:hypothetical protein